MLHQFFKHNKQSQGCHLIAESIELAGKDITSRCLSCAHHSLESTCSFLLFNKGSLGLWIKCHLQYPLEQSVLRVCCKIHYIMDIFLIWWSVVPKKKSNKPQMDTSTSTGVDKATALYSFLNITWRKVSGFGLGWLDMEVKPNSTASFLCCVMCWQWKATAKQESWQHMQHEHLLWITAVIYSPDPSCSQGSEPPFFSFLWSKVGGVSNFQISKYRVTKFLLCFGLFFWLFGFGLFVLYNDH